MSGPILYRADAGAVLCTFGDERLTVSQAQARRDRHLRSVETGTAITPEAALELASEITRAIAEVLAGPAPSNVVKLEQVA